MVSEHASHCTLGLTEKNSETYIRTREVFLPDSNIAHILPNLSRALEAGNSDILVLWRIQPVGVDERVVRHIGRANRDVTAREGRNQDGGNGGVVVPVHDTSRHVVAIVSEVAVRCEVPIREGEVSMISGGLCRYGDVLTRLPANRQGSSPGSPR